MLLLYGAHIFSQRKGSNSSFASSTLLHESTRSSWKQQRFISLIRYLARFMSLHQSSIQLRRSSRTRRTGLSFPITLTFLSICISATSLLTRSLSNNEILLKNNYQEYSSLNVCWCYWEEHFRIFAIIEVKSSYVSIISRMVRRMPSRMSDA